MRIQDKIKGQRIVRQRDGVKVPDELPVPHHSGYVDIEEPQVLREHQKITG